MVKYNYCPNCGNDKVLDITSDITYLACTNPSCRFCHIIIPPNSMGDRCMEYTTILSLDKWQDILSIVKKESKLEEEDINTTKKLIEDIKKELNRRYQERTGKVLEEEKN